LVKLIKVVLLCLLFALDEVDQYLLKFFFLWGFNLLSIYFFILTFLYGE
jgi:hypothetical protein